MWEEAVVGPWVSGLELLLRRPFNEGSLDSGAMVSSCRVFVPGRGCQCLGFGGYELISVFRAFGFRLYWLWGFGALGLIEEWLCGLPDPL